MKTNLLFRSIMASLFLRLKSAGSLPGFKRHVTISSFFFLYFLSPGAYAQWPIIGNEQKLASGVSSYTHIATAAEDVLTVPYVVFTEAGIAKVKKYIDTATWQQVGGDVSAGSATYTRIYIDANNKIYVCYVDAANGNRLALKTYNAGADVWEPLNGNADNLYLSAGSVTNTITQYSSTPRSILAFDTSNTPYIIYGEGSALNPTVKRYNGTAWELVGTGAVSADRAIGVGIAIDSTTNIPYIVYINQATATSSTGNLIVYRFTGGGWQNIPVPNPVPGGSATTGATTAIRHTSIAFNSQWNPVFSYFNSGNSNRATIVTYDKAAATFSYGGTVSTRDASNNSLYRDRTGALYASYTDTYTNGSGRSVARVMRQPVGATAWTELKDPTVTDGIDEPVGNLSFTAGEDTSKRYVVYTKTNSSAVATPVVRYFVPSSSPVVEAGCGTGVPDAVVTTPRQIEFLNRGLVAVRSTENQVYIGWRLLGTDASSISFNIYRDNIKLNATPIVNSTNYVDNTLLNGSYSVRPVINGTEQPAAGLVPVSAQSYLNIALQVPPGGTTPSGEAYTYIANDCSVGDVDGDGEYEIILKWDPSNAKDNSQSGYTGNVYLDAYKLNGTRLWRIDLGKNIRAGAHYTQFMVYDLDGDGKAEVACKTADGTIDGVGTVIGDANADYRNTGGYILSGPEFLTVFNGLTGAAMASANYLPARGTVSSWGDNYGNRVDRFIAAVAYLDGQRPSLVFGRGYYTRLVRAAWDWRNGQLTSRWVFDSNTPGNAAYAGQGNHQMTVADADGDGKDEVFNGSSAINDNGACFWANGMGHGDALHLSDIDPDRAGLEMWQPYEDPANNGLIGTALSDAKTGNRLFTVPLASAVDVGRGLSANIDPRYKGNEMWASRGNLYTATGVDIGTAKPSINFAIWWDADSTRELLDNISISKWNHLTNTNTSIFTATGCASNNGTKATPALSADILGDWREELILRTTDNSNLRIFTTTIPAENRFYTLMHDPQYRVAIAWQNAAYNQPPHPSFYIGEGMQPLPAPRIYVASNAALPVTLLGFEAKQNAGIVNISWKTANETANSHFTIERSQDGITFTSIYTTNGAGTSTQSHSYSTTDASPLPGTSYYRLKQTDVDGKFTYSAVKPVNMTATGNKLSVTPNPATSTVRLNFNHPASRLTLLLNSSDGKAIIKTTGSLSQLNTVLNNKLTTLNQGVYIVQLVDGSKVYTDKMIKQ